jgi:GT2 family glycosyltransferase
MAFIDVSISIVSYNSKNVLKDCIESIIKTAQGMKIEIIVVDNNSEDGSSDFVKANFPEVKLIENKDNLGFGKAHNQAFKISKGKYFLILNPDTIIFAGAINKMVEFMDNNKHVGVTGCKIFWDDEKNFMFPDLRIHSFRTFLMQFTPFCRYLPNSSICKWYWKTAYRLWASKIPVEVDGITGGLMLIRREIFESVGMFDENYFLFFEEHDLLKRIKNDGWKIYYLPDAEIQHYFEESFRNSPVDISRIYNQSAFYYYKKHYKTAGYYFIKLSVMFNEFILSLERYFPHNKKTCQEIHTADGRLIVKWPPDEKADTYLVEISYSPSFSDRGGMYIKGTIFSLNGDILKRLPNETGFLRVLPVYADNSTGKALQVMKITK